MPPLVPTDIKTILTPTELATIVRQYDADLMGKALATGLVAQYAEAKPYLRGIGDTIYPDFDPRRPTNPLSAANRERCAVALLTSRSRRLELALHIYLALVNGVEPDELAHIMLATAMYTGVDTLGQGFGILQRTLESIKPLAKAGTAGTALVLPKLLIDIPG